MANRRIDENPSYYWSLMERYLPAREEYSCGLEA
jgi:hypothetical protein